MPTKRNENYITDKILVPHYNKSSLFREFISEKFGKDFNFGDRISASCDSRNPEYGNPDAESKNGRNVIEVKISNSAKLQPNEKKGGGYEKKLKDYPDAHLLYIVNNDFPMEEAVAGGGSEKSDIGKRVRTIFWSEIYDFFIRLNSSDPDLDVLKASVQGLDIEEYDFGDNVRDVLSYLNSIHPSKACAIDYVTLKKLGYDDSDIFSVDYYALLEDEDDVWIPLKLNGSIRIFSDGVYLTCLQGRDEDSYSPEAVKILEKNKYKIDINEDYDEYMLKIMSLEEFKDNVSAAEKLSEAISLQEQLEEKIPSAD